MRVGMLKTISSGLGRVGRLLAVLLAALVGKPSWEAPPWLRWVGRKLAAVGAAARRQPVRALGVAAAVAVVGAGGGYGVRWYQHRPRPVETVVSVQAPGPMKLEDKAKPEPLVLAFSRSAAPLDRLRKQVTDGVELSPKVAGAWTWDEDDKLVFRPAAEWPVGERFTVRLAKRGLVSPTTRLERYQVEFRSAPFVANVEKVEFYQDPVDPKRKEVVATVAFSHPVDARSFEERVSLRLQADPKSNDQGKSYGFHVSYDKWRGRAFVHSDPIEVPQKDGLFVVEVGTGVRAERGGSGTEAKLDGRVVVPGRYNFLKVERAQLVVADNEKLEPEQILVVETSAGVSDDEAKRSVAAWLLPIYDPSDPSEAAEGRQHFWHAEFVGRDLLAKCEPVKLEALPGEREYVTTHTFRYRAPVGRMLYVQVKKGMQAFGGYLLAETWDATPRVPEIPRTLKIMQRGALLSLGGERKVPLYARDVPSVRFEIGRVRPGQLQNLVSQTSGDMASPSFMGWSFNGDNVSQVFREVRDLSPMAPGKPRYFALDLSPFLDGEGGRRGVFMLRAQSWNAAANGGEGASLGEEDRRLIVVSDLGLLVKDAADGAHDVFVASIHDGTPVGGARVQVLGKNGLAVAQATTDSEGHARIGSLREFRREQEPTLYLVDKAGDQTFLPIGREDRYLDLSRFDVGGVEDEERPKGLAAFVYSERGIYRPGDTIHGAFIVRGQRFEQDLDGVPVELVVSDARGLVVQRKRVRLGKLGYAELSQATQAASPTGSWTLGVYLVGKPGARDEEKVLLGSTTVQVREFQPDRMKIAVGFSSAKEGAAKEIPAPGQGWVLPDGLQGRVTLRNLYGTPAGGHRVTARIELRPTIPAFNRFQDFVFSDPAHADRSVDEALPEQQTDVQGEARFDLGLQRYAARTYRLSLRAEGLERDGGRGVADLASVVVSPRPFLVGYKADGDLRYVPRGSSRKVELVAVSPRGESMAAPSLRAVLLERKHVSVLKRQPNGTLAYESVVRDEPVDEQPLTIDEIAKAKVTKKALNTSRPGDFAWAVRDEDGVELARVEYTVAGRGNLDRSLERDAELQLLLKQRDVAPGAELEVEIKAPYAGAGLIAVERDRVYAYKWFKSATSGTVEHITLPPGFEGNGYVSVTMLRDFNSDAIYTSPLSYGVAPFSVSRERRTLQVALDGADTVKPGETLRLGYRVAGANGDEPSKIIVFAVDEGILRVARYHLPDPLAFFFRKRALSVRTAQILDLVLPEFSRLTAAPGGDDESLLRANLNPFRRKQDPPVVYWSGLLDAGPKRREVEWRVPDYFNGTLRVMAVAVGPSALGAAERTVLARGDFVLSPEVPSFAAPGDAFEVTVPVANNVAGSGKDARVEVAVATTTGMAVEGPAKVELTIPEQSEATARFRLRAGSQLGSATLHFTARLREHSSKLDATLSVRPPTPYLVSYTAGHLKPGQSLDVPVRRTLYAEHRALHAGVSRLPLGLAHGLVGYLEKFPHGCTEQIVSQAVPALALGAHPEFSFDAKASSDAVAETVAMLRTRQNDDGAFGLWAGGPHVAPFASAWAAQFLVEARDRGQAVPRDVLDGAMGWLKQLAASEGDSLGGERLRAYAVYLLTRGGMVTSRYASALQQRLDAQYPKAWRADLAAVYLAATYKLLHEDRLAASLLDGVRFSDQVAPEYADDYYLDPLSRNAQLLYLTARHFPERLPRVTPTDLDTLAEPIFQGRYNTYSSASAILALEAYGAATARKPDAEATLAMATLDENGKAQPLALGEGMLPWVDFSSNSKALRFHTQGPLSAFFLVSEAGFDTTLPDKPVAQKIEVYREYTDAAGAPISAVKLGDEVQVRVRLRALGDEPVGNVAVVDLLPGGFEPVVRQTAPSEADDDSGGGEDGDGEGEGGDMSFALPIALPGSTLDLDYGDVREDRVVLYATALPQAREFVYTMRATNAGQFAVPPILAESLYERTVKARGVGGTMKVEGRK